MSDEFRKVGLNTVSSADGFSVEVNLEGGVLYRDNVGEIRIDSEWLTKPHRILLYLPKVGDAKHDRVQSILPSLARALAYLGHPVEVWSNERN